jgi:multisubunit Na+/H+ antiporter MnhB subunit
MSTGKIAWVHGLGAAFIGGAAGALEAGLVLIVMAPDKFNLGKDLVRTLGTVAVFAVLSGVKLAAAYLKQSPLPAQS